LINNVLYVVILSAALDLVGPRLPKAIVLLFDVIPGFTVKLLAPYFIHHVPYSLRVVVCCALSAAGMLLNALTPAYTDGGTISTKMAGVVLASMSSGAGELSFLGLTHYYGQSSLAAWSSGTGAAGLVGAGAYAFATNTLKMSVRSALLASSFLPSVMLFSFFAVLPSGPLGALRYAKIPSSTPAPQPSGSDETEEDGSSEGLLVPTNKAVAATNDPFPGSCFMTLKHNLHRSRFLFIPYMLPLFLVYLAEYTINQGVSPTLLFPLASSPFESFRSFYPAYNAIYQAGVFISRSSTPILRIHNLYLPCLLQVVNLILLILQSLYGFLPSVWWVFLVVFWEGLLGGAVYVNTFAEILENVDESEREFSLGATTVSDSGGICIAGLLSLALETALCGWQIRHGRDWCNQL
ncbi:MAG: hypothetical protein LQ340_007163, partial [Diploschistes diacapsis]